MCRGCGKPRVAPGLGTALKPAWEPIIVARKSLDGTVAANVLAHGTGAINIDACRVAGAESTKRTSKAGTNGDGWGMGKAAHVNGSDAGRWPANVLHDGSDEVEAAFIAFGEKKSSAVRSEVGTRPGGFGNVGADKGGSVPCSSGFGDTGSSSRFFYAAKASKADRAGSKHPTVKPLALMRWLVRLVTPPGGTVLDPFAGSGTTLQAAREEGFGAIGIEREAEHHADILRRLAAMDARAAARPADLFVPSAQAAE